MLKRLVARPRPKLDWALVYPDFSFPSGHTMDSIVVLVAVAFVAWALFGRRVGIVATCIAIGLALLIGFSRIYLGAHFLTDVLGGYLAGAIWLIVVMWAFRAAWRRRTHEIATPAESLNARPQCPTGYSKRSHGGSKRQARRAGPATSSRVEAP